jgi:hypothetical protein
MTVLLEPEVRMRLLQGLLRPWSADNFQLIKVGVRLAAAQNFIAVEENSNALQNHVMR